MSSDLIPDGYQAPNEYTGMPVPDGYDFRRLSEGWCLDRRHGRLTSVPELPEAGWCEACGIGWSMPAGQFSVEVHLRPIVP